MQKATGSAIVFTTAYYGRPLLNMQAAGSSQAARRTGNGYTVAATLSRTLAFATTCIQAIKCRQSEREWTAKATCFHTITFKQAKKQASEAENASEPSSRHKLRQGSQKRHSMIDTCSSSLPSPHSIVKVKEYVELSVAAPSSYPRDTTRMRPAPRPLKMQGTCLWPIITLHLPPSTYLLEIYPIPNPLLAPAIAGGGRTGGLLACTCMLRLLLYSSS